MDRARRLVATGLLLAFAATGSWVLVASLVFAAAAGEAGGSFAELLASIGVDVALVAAALVAPAVVALLLLPRRPFHASVVATLYGLLVVGLTASHVREDGLLLAAHLGGLLLVLSAFPLGEPVVRATPPTGEG